MITDPKKEAMMIAQQFAAVQNEVTLRLTQNEMIAHAKALASNWEVPTEEVETFVGVAVSLMLDRYYKLPDVLEKSRKVMFRRELASKVISASRAVEEWKTSLIKEKEGLESVMLRMDDTMKAVARINVYNLVLEKMDAGDKYSMSEVKGFVQMNRYASIPPILSLSATSLFLQHVHSYWTALDRLLDNMGVKA